MQIEKGAMNMGTGKVLEEHRSVDNWPPKWLDRFKKWMDRVKEWIGCSVVPSAIPLLIFIIFNQSHKANARNGLLEFACFYFGVSGPDMAKALFFSKESKSKLHKLMRVIWGPYFFIFIVSFINLYMKEYDPTSNLLHEIPDYMRWIHTPGLTGIVISFLRLFSKKGET